MWIMKYKIGTVPARQEGKMAVRSYNIVYVTLRGEKLISSLGFKTTGGHADGFGASRANHSFVIHLPSYSRNITYTGRCAQLPYDKRANNNFTDVRDTDM